MAQVLTQTGAAMGGGPRRSVAAGAVRRVSRTGLGGWPGAIVLSAGLYYVLLLLDMIVIRQGEVTSGFVDEIFLLGMGVLAFNALARPHPAVRTVLSLYVLFVILALIGAGFNTLDRYDPNYPRWLAAGVAVLLDAKLLIGMLGFAAALPALRSDMALRYMLYILVGVALLNTPFVLRDITIGGGSIYGEALRVRSGFVQPQGLFPFTVDSADMTIIAAIAAGALYVSRRTAIWLAIWLGLVVLTLLHFSVKESVAALVCTAIIALAVPYKSAKVRAYVRIFCIGGGLLAAFPLAIYILPVVTERLDMYVGSDLGDTVRTYSHIVAVRIANDYFPLGSGAGTYASLPSRDYYFSPLYDIYGLSHMHGAARHFSGYLMDTFWPKILGEGGWLGLVAYLAMFGYIVRRAVLNLSRRTDGMNVFCLCILVTALVKSLAASVMTQETFVILLGFVIAYVLLHPGPARQRAGQRP